MLVYVLCYWCVYSLFPALLSWSLCKTVGSLPYNSKHFETTPTVNCHYRDGTEPPWLGMSFVNISCQIIIKFKYEGVYQLKQSSGDVS